MTRGSRKLTEEASRVNCGGLLTPRWRGLGARPVLTERISSARAHCSAFTFGIRAGWGGGEGPRPRTRVRRGDAGRGGVREETRWRRRWQLWPPGRGPRSSLGPARAAAVRGARTRCHGSQEGRGRKRGGAGTHRLAGTSGWGRGSTTAGGERPREEAGLPKCGVRAGQFFCDVKLRAKERITICIVRQCTDLGVVLRSSEFQRGDGTLG